MHKSDRKFFHFRRHNYIKISLLFPRSAFEKYFLYEFNSHAHFEKCLKMCLLLTMSL